MGSKKRNKKYSSSSSFYSDTSDSSDESRHIKKSRSKRHDYEANNPVKSKRDKTKPIHDPAGKEKRRPSVEQSRVSDYKGYRSRKRSRSSSDEKKSSYRERSQSKSHSKDYSRREKERESGASYSVGGSRSTRDYEESNRRKLSASGNYDSRVRRDDRRKDSSFDYKNNNKAERGDGDRSDDWKGRGGRDNRRRSPSKSFDHTNAKWGKGDQSDSKDTKKEVEEKQKPNFALSGKLTEETNTFRGVVIKYSEPPEARKPRRRWRLYPFKGEKALQTLYIHRESAYLIGRDRKVVDLAVDHPSCSKQHAALQYRLVSFTREDGSTGKRVRPYLIDLDSANGTFINNKKIDPKKYVELLEKDVIKFGFSSREYVLLHENSKDETMDDDVKIEDEELKGELDIKEDPN